MYSCYYLGVRLPEAITRVPPISLLRQLDRGKIKVFFGTFLILGSISWNLNVTFPAPFSTVLSYCSILQFNFVSIECVTGKHDYLTKVYTSLLTPLIIAAIMLLYFGLRLLQKIYALDPDTISVHKQAFQAFMLLAYVSLPPVSLVQFRSLGEFA